MMLRRIIAAISLSSIALGSIADCSFKVQENRNALDLSKAPTYSESKAKQEIAKEKNVDLIFFAINKIDAVSRRKILEICQEIKEAKEKTEVEIAIVVGGGNFWRGRNGKEMERTTSDYMGMLATVMNGLALQDALEARGMYTRVQTAIEMRQIAEPYIKRKALKHLERGRIVIFSCGTGNPYFTTDTTAALRAAEIEADVILVAKTIDGVYSADPKVDPNAIKYDKITYLDILNKDLKVMDSTATSLCRDNNIPLLVFGINEPENILKAVMGEKIGTLVEGE